MNSMILNRYTFLMEKQTDFYKKMLDGDRKSKMPSVSNC